MNSFGKFLLRKEVNAAVIAFICALFSVFNFPTGVVAVIIVGLVTLQKGPKSGFWLLAWVALPTIALLALREFGLFDVLLLRCILMWAVATCLRRYCSWMLLVEVATLLGVILVVLLHFYFPHLHEWWRTELLTYMKPIISASHWDFKVTAPQFADLVAPMATGLVSFFIIGTLLLQLIIARFWQLSLVSPGSFVAEFTQIRVGRISTFLVVMLLLLGLFEKQIALDALPLVLLPFFAAGLSLMHFFAQQKKKLIYVLILMYMGLFFLPAVVISALAALAFIDTFCGFRKIKLGTTDH
ncbi:MAG: hypothetical protein NTZ67_05285 [Gammaproteobacteria bacterium]|nr:hypothetical protein [Gammaproteobacteria bacterium]